MKEKRIEQLEQGMDDRKAEAELRRAEMISIQKKLDSERDETKNVELKNDALKEQNKILTSQLDLKETDVANRIEQLNALNVNLEQAKKMLKRRDHEITRKDTQISNMKPETEEVCLSARSFSENMMVSIQSDAVPQNVAAIIVTVIFIGAFFFYCLLCNHSFQTNPNKMTNCFQLFSLLQLYKLHLLNAFAILIFESD
jgi:chromosome segregation ATPase